MKLLITLTFTLLTLASAQAEQSIRPTAMSKTTDIRAAEAQTKTTNDAPKKEQRVDRSVVVQHSGVNYSPVVNAIQPMNAQPRTGLYKGQQMRSEQGHRNGEITGSILVKTSQQEALLASYANATRMGSDYVLISFDANTNVLAELKTLQQRPDVEQAELEINTKRYKPR